VETLAPLPQLRRGLRPAQHQHREERDPGVVERERAVEQVAELRGPAAGPAREPRPAAVAEPVQRLADLVLVEIEDRVAVRRLVAGEPERVERERILVRCRPLLLDEAAQHAQLDGVQVHAPSLPRATRRTRLLW